MLFASSADEATAMITCESTERRAAALRAVKRAQEVAAASAQSLARRKLIPGPYPWPYPNSSRRNPIPIRLFSYTAPFVDPLYTVLSSTLCILISVAVRVLLMSR